MNRDYYKAIQRAIDMIEDSLGEELSLGKLAKAAYAMTHTDHSLLDIALNHGFGTYETFNRAFKQLFGMSPSAYRRAGIRTPRYDKPNIAQRRYNPYLGGIRMDYRMATKPAFKVIGCELRTSSVDGRNLQEIPAFWQQYFAENGGDRIPNRVHADSVVELGICTDFDMATGEFSYIIGMEATGFDGVPEGLVCRTSPEQTYAVFTTPAVEPEAFSPSIQATWKAVFEEWFPHSGYEHTGGIEFEWYDERCHRDKHERIQMNIYVPVKASAQ